MHSQRYAAKDDAMRCCSGEAGHSGHQSLTVRAAARSASAAVRCLQKRVNAPLSEEELKIELKIYYGQRDARV